MGAVGNALIRTRTMSESAHVTALSMKKAGTLPDILDAGFSGMGSFASYADQTGNKQRYALFRGWVHAAVNAVAQEGASQDIKLGKMKGAKQKGSPSGTKSVGGHIIRKMPNWMKEKAAKTEIEIIDDHDILDLLAKPNPIQHKWQFIYSFIANICLTGWGYIVGGKNEESGEFELYSLPTTWVVPDHSKGAFAEFRIVNPRNPQAALKQKPLTKDQVVFAHIPNPSDPLSATAPAAAQNIAIKIDDCIQQSQLAFFPNAVFPSAIITVGKNPHPDVPGGIRPRLNAEQRRQVYGAVKKVMSGVANYGNPAIIDGMIESIERMSASQNEVGWEKSEKTIRTRILSAFGVHPFILGEEMIGSYAQAFIVEGRYYKRVNVYLSMLGTLLTNFAPQLTDSKEGEKLLIWVEELIAKDPSMEKSTWEGARTRDDVSQNEFRGWMGLAPDEDKEQAIINKTLAQPITAIAAQCNGGQMKPEQAVAILTGMGLPEELAKKIAGKGPDQAMLDQQQQDQGGWGGQAAALDVVLKALNDPNLIIQKSQGFLEE